MELSAKLLSDILGFCSLDSGGSPSAGPKKTCPFAARHTRGAFIRQTRSRWDRSFGRCSRYLSIRNWLARIRRDGGRRGICGSVHGRTRDPGANSLHRQTLFHRRLWRQPVYYRSHIRAGDFSGAGATCRCRRRQRNEIGVPDAGRWEQTSRSRGAVPGGDNRIVSSIGAGSNGPVVLKPPAGSE